MVAMLESGHMKDEIEDALREAQGQALCDLWKAAEVLNWDKEQRRWFGLMYDGVYRMKAAEEEWRQSMFRVSDMLGQRQ